jgi:hypothetical protein
MTTYQTAMTRWEGHDDVSNGHDEVAGPWRRGGAMTRWVDRRRFRLA